MCQKRFAAVQLFLQVVAVSLCLPTAAAMADRSETLIKQAVELRRQGNDKAALPKFEAAYQEAHTARSAAQLGLCEQALKLWFRSYTHIAEAMESKSDPWIVSKQKVLSDAVAQSKAHLGVLQLTVEPNSADVYINGVHLGTSAEASSTVVEPGVANLSVRLDKFEPYEAPHIIAAGQILPVEVRLKASGPVPPVPSIANEASGPQLYAGMPAQPEESNAKTSSSRPLLWGGLALLAIAAGTLIVVLSMRDTKYPDAQQTVTFPPR